MNSPAISREPHLPAREGVSPSCVVLPAGAWATVADFLAHRFPHISRAIWVERLRRGDVFGEYGLPLGPDSPYCPQRKLYYYRSLPQEAPIPFEENVIYQDDWIVVADKPHFLPVTPSGRFLQETLLVRLKRRLGINTLAPVHRIDLDTAGLVLFTIQPETRNAYQSLFRERKVVKAYEAIAPWREDVLLPSLARHRLAERPEAFMQMQIVEGPPNAETQIALTEKKGNLGRYALQPITGKRHQLRAQMAALGRPIINDRIYPVLEPETPPGETPDFNRPLQLLAKSIAFTDPVTGQSRHFKSKRCLIF